ncbi:hypothetical protein ZIOFF_031540 [Zingiber officinale]|uniref:CHASE domain-containing protein n=1 Tax=Zingiber officinale TaxID=94328 RepID=A0A8J5GHU9_ZINOF|nr:hypothetical protein ZIOFF_031540 [Zingiber officinale]
MIHGKQPSAIDQQIFATYTRRTAFERPLMSGVAYALRVLHAEREEFEKKYGWRIKKMATEDQSLVKDDYNLRNLTPLFPDSWPSPSLHCSNHHLDHRLMPPLDRAGATRSPPTSPLPRLGTTMATAEPSSFRFITAISSRCHGREPPFVLCPDDHRRHHLLFGNEEGSTIFTIAASNIFIGRVAYLV